LLELDRALNRAHVPYSSEAVPTVATLATRIARVLQVRSDKFTQTSHLFERALGAKIDDDELALTVGVRDAVLQARDPVRLLFLELPTAVGMAPVQPGHGGTSAREAPRLAKAISSAVARLWVSSDLLAAFVADRFVRAATGQERLGPLLEQVARLTHVPEQDLPNNVRQLVLHTVALSAAMPECRSEQARQKAIRDWVRAIVTNVTGRPLEQWRDADIEPLTRAVEADAQDLRQYSDLVAVSDGDDGAFAVRLLGKGGYAHTRVVRVGPGLSPLTNSIVDNALERLTLAVGNDQTALDALLAVIAGRAAGAGDRSGMKETP
jgi:hypothetical protein